MMHHCISSKQLIQVGLDLSSPILKLSFIGKLISPSMEQYHPDLNKGPGAEEKFKEISAAYEVFLLPTFCFVCHHLHLLILELTFCT